MSVTCLVELLKMDWHWSGNELWLGAWGGTYNCKSVYSDEGRSSTTLASVSLAQYILWHGWTSFEKSLTCLVELIHMDDSHWRSGNELWLGAWGVTLNCKSVYSDEGRSATALASVSLAQHILWRDFFPEWKAGSKILRILTTSFFLYVRIKEPKTVCSCAPRMRSQTQ